MIYILLNGCGFKDYKMDKSVKQGRISVVMSIYKNDKATFIEESLNSLLNSRNYSLDAT